MLLVKEGQFIWIIHSLNYFVLQTKNIVDDNDQEKKIDNLVLYPLTATQMKIIIENMVNFT